MADVSVIDVMGGAVRIGALGDDSFALIAAVRRGFPIEAIEYVVASGRLTPTEIDEIIIPRKTLSHRRRIGNLTAEQSDRFMRAARVIADAELTFGSREKAGQWLRRPTSALRGEKPLSLVDTNEGAHQVETLLGRIAHGIAA